MGKRAVHRHYSKNMKGDKKVKKDWRCSTIPQDNEYFRRYYELQLVLNHQQFQIFWSYMKKKLPVVFRVNQNCPFYSKFADKLNNQQFVQESIQKFSQTVQKNHQSSNSNNEDICNINMIQDGLKNTSNDFNNNFNHQPKQIPKIEPIQWFPGGLVYTLNTTKQIFKKSKILQNLHQQLQKCFDSGLVCRQQLVSMLPPLYLSIESDDIVLDMCAAPGSKTSQMLQMIYKNNKISKGCVIANDADYSRANMLIHQIYRAGTTGMAVINHSGQFLPELYSQKNQLKFKFQFDKILCDVPCSGDGATRKLPIKWFSWHPNDGMVLHPLQLSILMKSVNLLKRGGLLAYSTCSLNPIQNQAVISGLMKKVKKGLQIIDIHPMFGVQGYRGLLHWKVCTLSEMKKQSMQKQEQNIEQKQKVTIKQKKQFEQKEVPQKQKCKKYLKVYQNYEQVKHIYKIKETMFAPTQEQAQIMGLHHTMRILPHIHDSGGFYVALLRKNHDFEWNYQISRQKVDKKNQQINQKEDEQEQFVKNNLPECDNEVVVEDNHNIRNQQSDQEDQVQRNKLQIKEYNESQQKIYCSDVKKKIRQLKYEKFIPIVTDDFLSLSKFYGLPQNLCKLLYVRSNAQRKVIMISEGVKKFLQADIQNKIKLINMGCKVFQKNKQSFSGHQCFYRLCQQGIHFILPYLTNRKIKVNLQFFKIVLSIQSLTHDQIHDINLQQQIRNMTYGSFCIYINQQINGQLICDAIIGQNFQNSFHLMLSKQDIASFHIRYL